MIEVEESRTISRIVSITIGLIVAVLIGILFGLFAVKLFHRKIFALNGSTRAVPTLTVGFVDFTDSSQTTCVQKVNGIPYARPPLSKSNLDTMKWRGRSAVDQIAITFPASGDFGPFQLPSYRTGQISSSSTGDPNDYSYTDLAINGKHCTNPGEMGVHITN